ncbi:interleukin-12 receptor subunit beta-2-like [Narcine bancroftii]|uniref:interleukin-12 receptor subunit beta-2-like n=1 Tax=Narcine bancroftii TaxID=1343680 RepID=UPI003831E6EE
MVSALEHFVEYVFLIRARFHHTRGLWSDWSSSFVTRTPEAAPIGQLDVWYTMDPSDLQNSRVTLLWKPLKTFESRGIILGYNVTLQESSKNNTAVWTQKTKNTWYTVGFPRIDCVITVSAYNSKGSSPPTELHLSFLRDLPSARSISMIYTENNSLLIEWMEPIKPPEAVQEYVVEWMEVNGKLNQNINWFKVPPQNCSSRLTENIKPKTCFQIFVYAVYKSGVGRPVSTQKYTAQEVAPLSGPSVFTKRNTAELFWNNIPQDQKGGCLTSYRIYIQKEESKWPPAIYKDIDPSSRTYTITNLKPGAMYIVWMTAVTKAGEGKNGKPHRFYLSHKNTLLHSDSKSKIMIVVAVTFTIAVTVSGFCLWQSIRNSMFSILSKLTSQLYVKNIPDPANCTWAKEYTAIKGNLDFTYPYFQVDSTSAYEDPHSLQIEEILSDHELCSSLEADQDQNSQLSIFQIQHTASQLQQSEALSQGLSSGNNKEDMLDYKCQLPCLYVEKLSSGEIDHQLKDSQNSAVDQSIGYIPSNFIHITDNTTEANNQGFIDSFSIIPLPSLSRLAITYEGKLTLDVVRIDCSSLIE